MSVIGGWLLAPLVLTLLCFGVGLLCERAARVPLPGPAVPGVGLAGIIVVAGLLTILDATAEFAAPVCALLAVAGLVLGRRRLGAASVAVFVLAFALFAWPSLASGQGSIAGYIKLDDSAIWLGLMAHLAEHGRDISGVPPSTFRLDLELWLDSGYPIGTFTPAVVTSRLSGQDLANVYQPVVCVYGALCALGLFGVVRTLVRSRALAGASALIAVHASLFAGYVWWGGIKEACVAALLPLFVLVRSLPLAGLVGAALMCAFGVGGVLWAGAGCLAAIALTWRAPLREWVAGVGLLVLGSVPVVAVIRINAVHATKGAPVQQEDLGKLYAPPDLLQGAGLWPAGDFRVAPDPKGIAVALAVAGLVAALAAVVVAVRRRAWLLPALVAATVAGAVPALVVGGPWIDAKVLAVTSGILLAATAAGVAVGLERWRWLAVPAAAVLLAGVVSSSWLAAREVYVAPRDTLSELRTLGRQVAGKGPMLLLNYEGYGTRYALYRGAIEGASDLRVSQIPSRSGEPFPNFSTVEIDDVETAALFAYPLIGRRRTPVGSRPPSAYVPFASGHYFETWRRDGGPPVEHLSLGGGLAPAADVQCRRLRQLARGGATLVAAPRENPVVVDLAGARMPAAWRTDTGVRPVTDGTARIDVDLPHAATWRTWVGGGALGGLEVLVDGKPVGSVRHRLDASVGWMRFAARRLDAGRHVVELRASRRWWQPGRGADASQLPLGPLALTDEREAPLERLPSADVDRLCDARTYDWVEVY